MTTCILPEPELSPVRDPQEALEAWRRIYADDGPAVELDVLCRRLALGMILLEDVRDAIADGLAADLPPVQAFITRLAALSQRVRITPLLYLAEHDGDAAMFLIRHPHVISPLLQEQDLHEENSEDGLTSRIRSDLPSFFRRMKVIAPLLLERAEIPRGWTERFLEFMHRPRTHAQLSQVKSVRDALGAILADFCREHGILKEQEAHRYVTKHVIDNILWQVAAVNVRRDLQSAQLSQVSEALENVVVQLQREGKAGADNTPEYTVGMALAGFPADVREEVQARMKHHSRLLM